MKRFVCGLAALACLLLSGLPARASWSALTYSGYQPWWNIFAKRYKCMTPEEARLQKFWHDYYSALKNYYCDLDHIDWVAYYKNHGYQINGGCAPGGCGRINYAPVFVSPTIQWAIPAQSIQGAGCGPMPCGPGCPVGPGCGAPMMLPPGGGYPGGMPPGAAMQGMPPGMQGMPGMGGMPQMMPAQALMPQGPGY